MTSAPPTTATTSFQIPRVALATPCCKLGLLLPPVADAAGAPKVPPVTGASTTVTEVCVLILPSGSVRVDKIVEEEGVKETISEEASTVVKTPLPPLLPDAAGMEKTTRPLDVAIGVAEGGVEMGTACVVGARVAVVRDETGRMMPLDVDGAGAEDRLLGDRDASVAGGREESDDGGGETMVEELGLLGMVVVLLLWRLAMRRREVARGGSWWWTTSRAVRSREKTPSLNLEDQRWRAEWMEDSSTSASRRWKTSRLGGPCDGCCCCSCCCC